MKSLADILPDSLSKEAEDVVNSIDEVAKIADDKIDNAIKELQDGLNKSLDEASDITEEGVTKGKNTSQQTATDPPDITTSISFTNGLVKNPKSIWGKSAEDIKKSFQEAGYEAEIKKSTQGSKLSQQVRIKGHPEISNIQVHPGGGRHGGAYYKISTSTQGKIKVVDPSTYKATPGEKAKIINFE